MRKLIRPNPGFAAAYVDWVGNEVGIAGFLSQDQLMMEMYESLILPKFCETRPPCAAGCNQRNPQGNQREIQGSQFGSNVRSRPSRNRKPIKLHSS